ncbi:MAG TPA: DUF4293 domain-containing protein [Bacteroidales bacterium]|nr:DUF4293 domain-containing protein [Bacteroidales bacterium]HOE05928.1 DUF4293 domain-containing protein [Bacteroidales bacterium]
MIQRIQSVYLLVSAILMAVIVFIPFGSLILKSGAVVDFGALGVTVQTDATTVVKVSAWPVLVMVSLSGLVSLLTIFLFKKRMLQIRLCAFNLIVSLGCIALMFIYLHQAGKYFDAKVYYSVMMAFPAVCAILQWLAMRAIGKDEALIRSIDRIR